MAQCLSKHVLIRQVVEALAFQRSVTLQLSWLNIDDGSTVLLITVPTVFASD